MTTRTEILRTILIVWFMAATGYVVYDIWNDYKVKSIEIAYQNGIAKAVNELIKQVESSQCQAVDIFSGDKKIQVIDFVCVSEQQNQGIEEKK